MAFFTEAAVLSAAWANHEELQGLGAKQSLCVIRAKKLSRGYLQAHGMNTIDSALHVSHPCMHACMSEYMEWGDVARNKEAVALAIKHLGMRPSLGMVEQAVYQFFSLCIPRGKEVCSSLALKIFGFHTCMHYHAIWCYHVMHVFFLQWGVKHKMQSRVIKQLMFKFSRIAKMHGIKFACMGVWIMKPCIACTKAPWCNILKMRRPHCPRDHSIRDIFRHVGIKLPGAM